MVKVVKIAGLRKAVAERLGYSWRNCLPVALMTDFDASSLLKSYREGKERYGENSPSITAFVVKSVGDLLSKHREFNANIEGDEIKILDEVNIAVAVDTPRGLYAPTVRNVDAKTILQVESELRTLVDKAMKGTITLNELAGHGFTVSNLGHLGVTYFTPIINPPDICILGVGAMKEKRGYLTLVFDHRAVDGAPAAAFLHEIRNALEAASLP